MMRAALVLISVVLSSVATAEPRVFYTAHFADNRSIELSVTGDGVPQDGGYDFDVAIGLAEISSEGALQFFDGSTHHARIRCAPPAYVRFGEHRFPMAIAGARPDWKQDLWKAYCEVPSS
jgi:hypothetical protein